MLNFFDFGISIFCDYKFKRNSQNMYIQCDKLETLQGYFKFVHGERYFTFVTFLFRSQLQKSQTPL